MKLDKLCLINGDYFDHCIYDSDREPGYPNLWTNGHWVFIAYEGKEIIMRPMHQVAWATPRADLTYGQTQENGGEN